MTISSTTVKNSYLGNGTLDTFNYTFKIFADSDLQVIIRSSLGTETVKTLTTHYTVTGAGSASGGTIVFTAGNIPTATETVVIRRAVPQTQAIDYIANDPFPAESHEEGLDRSMMAIQQIQEEVDRSIKISRTNTMSSTEFTVGASNRAGKILGFDSAGELVVSQELGSFQGNWSSGETYAARDIVKDTSNGNIYLCNTGHTSSGAEPISTNTDSAKWDLLVDAETATSSATAAASSASAAATSASNAASSASSASSSASSAASSLSSVETIYDNFDDRFLGTKASDPTLDNDGNALVEGSIYYNSTTNEVKFYNVHLGMHQLHRHLVQLPLLQVQLVQLLLLQVTLLHQLLMLLTLLRLQEHKQLTQVTMQQQPLHQLAMLQLQNPMLVHQLVTQLVLQAQQLLKHPMLLIVPHQQLVQQVRRQLLMTVLTIDI